MPKKNDDNPFRVVLTPEEQAEAEREWEFIMKALGAHPVDMQATGGDNPPTENEHPNLNVIKLPKNYNPNLCNTTITADELANKLTIALAKEDKPDCISLLFDGVAGTGKTISACYIANAIGKPLVSYAVGDIVNKYVGESESTLAKVFADAEKHGHVLHLDEIDSIAGAREEADKNHEAKLTNALLQAMDRFKGIFIATTNFKGNLDRAVKRRFLLKQTFKNCTAEQARELSRIYFGRKAPRELPDCVLAPADFDIVKKSLLFVEDSEITRKYILSRLIEEATDRNGKDLTVTKPAMGFIS